MEVKKRKAPSKITREKFNAARILKNSGATYKEVADALGISKASVSYIVNSETYEEYRQKMAAVSATYRKATAEQMRREEERKAAEAKKAEEEAKAREKAKAETVAETGKGTSSMMVSVYQVNRMIDLLAKQNELLTLISAKIAFIVDELTK